MTKEFGSLGAFANHLQKVVKQYPKRQRAALDFIGQHIEDKSKKAIGHYQKGADGFEDWQELSESTKADKVKKGYVFNDEFNPLYREGDLKESIHHVVSPLNGQNQNELGKVYIGSPLDIALYQEMGTAKIPARSFLGLTLFKEKYQIEYILGLFLNNWIINTYATLRKKE